MNNLFKSISLGIGCCLFSFGIPASMNLPENIPYSIFLALVYMTTVFSYLLLSKK
ncbi:MAG: hypothetical protein RSA01_07420 [Clostridium sp.]|uniref:hypothetical protein n=1 Tax=Clostridium sp. TaxID=1506 RepID=UPI002FC8008C